MKNLGVIKDSQEFLDVVVEGIHQLLEIHQEFGIRGRGVVHHVVDRLDQPDTHDFLPQSVGDHGGKPGISVRGKPVGIGFTRGDFLKVLVKLYGEPEDGLGLDLLVGLGVVVLVVLGQADLAFALAVQAELENITNHPG